MKLQGAHVVVIGGSTGIGFTGAVLHIDGGGRYL
jgi:hypothetical protein